MVEIVLVNLRSQTKGGMGKLFTHKPNSSNLKLKPLPLTENTMKWLAGKRVE